MTKVVTCTFGIVSKIHSLRSSIRVSSRNVRAITVGNFLTSPSIFRLPSYKFSVDRRSINEIHISDQSLDHGTRIPEIQENDIENLPSSLVKEDVIGISEFVCKDGFYGLMKVNISDFLVNEILMNGQVVRLTDLSNPDHKKTFQTNPKLENVRLILADYFPEREITELIKLNEGESSDSLLITPKHLSKAAGERLRICFRNKFPNLKIKLIKVEGKMHYSVQKSVAQAIQAQKNDEKAAPVRTLSYLHFVLCKENISSFDAHQQICSALKIPNSELTYAGLKDKKGITTQMVSVGLKRTGVTIEQVITLNQNQNIKVGNFVYKNQHIEFGDHYGNHFEIVLRGITAPEDEVQTVLQNMQRSGFINYFGLQRFGYLKTSHMKVGRLLFQCNWKEAVDLILQPRDFIESKSLEQCRRVWWETRDAEAALQCLQKSIKTSREGLLLKGLIASGPDNYREALEFLPTMFKRFYLHSYASYLWNAVVSKRIAKYGMEVLPGDMFFEPRKGKLLTNHNAKPSIVCNKILQGGYVSIFDVVVPLFGNKVGLPENEIRQWFEEFLEADGLNIDLVNKSDMFNTRHGSYRPIVVLPENLIWSFINNENPNPMGTVGERTDAVSMIEKKALKLEFDLQASSYATVAIREITKMNSY